MKVAARSGGKDLDYHPTVIGKTMKTYDFQLNMRKGFGVSANYDRENDINLKLPAKQEE